MSRTHFLIILLAVLCTTAPLFRPGLYTSHDGENHLVRIARFSRLLSQGQLYPRWDDSLIFNFVYPLPYYVSSLFHFLSLSIVDSFKITLILFTLLSALFFYLWTKHLPATFLFLFTPYRFVNLYVRAAFGEIVFLGLLPAAFWLINKKNYVLLAILLSLLIFSHLQLSLIFLPILFLYAQTRKVIPSFIIALMLSSIFWLPATFLVRYTKHASVTQFVPSQHLPTINQLIYSTWGFGFSRPGLADDMSFQLGLTSWLVLLLSTLRLQKKLILIIVWLSLILMIANPLGFWDWPLAKSIQFSWRLLLIPLILIPFTLSRLNLSRPVLVIISVLAIYANRNHIRTNLPQFVSTPDSYFEKSQVTTTATPDEFMPIAPRSTFTSHPIISLAIVVSGLGLISLVGLKSRHA